MIQGDKDPLISRQSASSFKSVFAVTDGAEGWSSILRYMASPPEQLGSPVHATSFAKMQTFVHHYLHEYRWAHLEILDFGSQEVSGQTDTSYRPLFNSSNWNYRGLDLVPGENVDIIVEDAFSWKEVDDDSIDVVISGQALEHVDYFWISAFEIGRVLRPGGIAALIAPSSGPEHRYPLDCWRYYTDGFEAIARYLGFAALDVYTDWGRAVWADSMLVMQKPLWTLDERYCFRVALAHQRAVLPPHTFYEPQPEAVLPTRSVLSGIEGGGLSRIFDADRIANQDQWSFVPRAKDALRAFLPESAVTFLKSTLRAQ